MMGMKTTMTPSPVRAGHPTRTNRTIVVQMIRKGKTKALMRIGALASRTQRSFAIRFVIFAICSDELRTKLVIFDSLA